MFTLTRCLQTSDTPAMLPVFICRLVMGVFFFTAGFNKLFVPENQLLMLDTLHDAGIPFPAVMAVVVAFLECFMGLLLTLGLFTRFSALTLMIISSVALATIGIYTIPPGLNLIAWLSWLFYLPEALYIVLGLVLISLGGTCYSVDGWLVKRWQSVRKIIFIDG
ncbi:MULTISPECIES: DoxX family protein [Enterobacter cloacae complex]|uniref:DoxX family protein n=1 Tax=Enterobacter TaxID=547 RepID=UPI000750468B|nr:DoxX family protein [Enterobacter ludwigii]ELN9420536.1 DoxX family protein [Enterobacter ludwigii]KUQ40534.1 transmembrane DoxX protein [Enterobacter ludwigii]MBX8877886.1 DoxX family protein [Enterobacter ludwigii]MDF9915565.1 DoxX family protein [Enterobacter ludwigii]MDH1543863.1 DoxX family protein [Enterobacter ludwigii]